MGVSLTYGTSLPVPQPSGEVGWGRWWPEGNCCRRCVERRRIHRGLGCWLQNGWLQCCPMHGRRGKFISSDVRRQRAHLSDPFTRAAVWWSSRTPGGRSRRPNGERDGAPARIFGRLWGVPIVRTLECCVRVGSKHELTEPWAYLVGGLLDNPQQSAHIAISVSGL